MPEASMSATITPSQRRRDEAMVAQYRRCPSERLLSDLVERYRPLARSLAMRYRGASEPMEDLIQVAELGLVAAIRGYDPERGKSFTAYAVPTILGEIRHHFRDKVWNLRLPRALQESTAAVEKASERLIQELGRFPTVEEIAERTELDKTDVLAALEGAQARFPLSADGATEEGEPPVIEQLGQRELGYDRVEAALAATTAGLDDRELSVLRMRFQEGMTQRDIGELLGVSQMQVSRISRGGMRKLIAAVRGEAQGAENSS
jgi:RNA polymerase sigma-B factor